MIERLAERLIDWHWRYRDWRRRVAIWWHPDPYLVIRWTACPVDGNNVALEELTGKQGDLLFQWGARSSSRDGAMLHNWLSYGKFDPSTREFSPSLLEELAERGYDLTTLEFSIRKKPR